MAVGSLCGMHLAGGQNGLESEGARAAERGMHSRDRSQSNMSEMYDNAASAAGSMQGMIPQHTAAANGNGHGFMSAETSDRGTLDALSRTILSIRTHGTPFRGHLPACGIACCTSVH